jgi:hypothetical protein
MDAQCFVCGKQAETALGIRLRRRNTNAIWAPNLHAYLCDLHARSGAEIEVRYKETLTGRIAATVIRDGKVVATVGHEIGKATQESLF